MRKFKTIIIVCFALLMCAMTSCKKKCDCSGFCFNCGCDKKSCSCTENLPSEFAKTIWYLQVNNARFSTVKIEVKAEDMRLTYTLVSGLSKSLEEVGEFVFVFKYQFEPNTGFFSSVEEKNYGINGNLIDNYSLEINLPTGDKVTLTRKQ